MEDWKDKIMSSLEGIERAKPNQEVLQKILAKVEDKKRNERKQWIAVAATITLVLCANVYFVLSYNSSVADGSTDGSYAGVLTNFNIYE